MPASVWKGHLAFGLVTIPVKLQRAARAEKVRFHQLHKQARAAGESPGPEPPSPPKRGRTEAAEAPQAAEPAPVLTRIRQAAYVPDAEEGRTQPVPRSELVRGFEYDPGQYVEVSNEDLRAIAPETRRDMQIVEFVRLAEIDPVYFESSYYVVPDNGGERPYALFFATLRETGYVGLAELAMHRREHIVAIRPGRRGLIAHTMFYPSEVHAEEEYRVDAGAVKPRELEMAKLLVESQTAKFEPEKFRDTYRERLEQLIQSRIEGHQTAAAARPPERAAEVVDIMEALQKSLAAVKKPVAAAAAKPARKRSAG
jgi:DNA end-binding protein Ku